MEPTIDIKSKKFKQLLKNFLRLYFFWNSFFEKNEIKAVIGVHTPTRMV